MRNTKTLIDEKFVIYEFDAGSEVSGVLEYPFIIKIPEWLQPSLMCQFEDNNISLTYYLCAQFDPNTSDQVANDDDGTSTLRADCTVYLYKSLLDEETKEQSLATTDQSNVLKQSLQMTIGGIAGIGSTQASAEISVEKLEHHVGDGIRVHIEMNNSECAKPVKSYKFKLRRNIKCYNRKHNLLLEKEEYLIEIKEEGCEAKKTHTKDYSLEIPTAD